MPNAAPIIRPEGTAVENVVFEIAFDPLENDLRSLLMAFYPGATITRTAVDQTGAGRECAGAANLRKAAERAVALRREDGTRTAVVCLMGGDCFYLAFDSGTLRRQAVSPYRPEAGRKELRTVFKKLCYRMLSCCTGKKLPWGTLTGIRPTKIARQMLDAGESREAVVRYMEDEMLSSPKKTRLSLEIARRERSLLEQVDLEDGYSLYIGIPFCPTTCAYCSFTSYPISRFSDRVDEYLDCLEKELDFVAEAFGSRKLNAVYLGGGTPTTLSPAQSDRLLGAVEKRFHLDRLKEWTVEGGRPDSITPEKLSVLKAHPVTRISINPQTMKEETLRKIGRRHTAAQVLEAFRMAREAGFDNINMDMIVGLPDETPRDVEYTLQELSRLAPDSLTVHSLAIKRAARLNTSREDFAGSSSYNSEDLMELAEGYARSMGLAPYYLYRQKNMAGNLENVGYAAPGKEGFYNILIMEEVQPILAVGAGAVSKGMQGNRIERCENVKDITSYLARIDEMIERKKRLLTSLELW